MNISGPDFRFVRDLVRSRAAIVLDDDKQYLVEVRLTSLCLRESITSIGALVDRLRRCPDELERKVVEAMTTNETMWFRDSHPFEALRNVIIPELIERRRKSRSLNLWCGASSTGQEPYSVLMLLREYFPQLCNWNVNFIATDISTEVLAKAREGRYSQLEVNRGLSQSLLAKYFDQDGGNYKIKADLRRAVDFRVLNLSREWPSLPEMDIVFLRNVLIYFDVPTKKKILGRIRRVLHKDGYFFVGSAETTLNLDDGFIPVNFEKSVYYRLRNGAEPVKPSVRSGPLDISKLMPSVARIERS